MKNGSVSGDRGPFGEDARESFTLPSRYYLDPDIHAAEIRRIFLKGLSQITNPNAS